MRVGELLVFLAADLVGGFTHPKAAKSVKGEEQNLYLLPATVRMFDHLVREVTVTSPSSK